MLKQSSQIQYQLEQMIDALVAAGAFTLALATRRWLNTLRPDIFPPFDALWSHAWLYMLLIPLWVFLLDLGGYYQHKFARSSVAMHRTLLRANVLGVMLAFFLLYVLKIKHIPRVLILIYGTYDVVLMLIKESIARRFERVWSRESNLILVGEPAGLADVLQRLRSIPPWQVNILGVLVPREYAGSMGLPEIQQRAQPVLGDLPVLGTVDNLHNILHGQSVDYVALSPGQAHFDEIQKTIRICEVEGVEIWMLADFVRTSIAHARVDELQDLPMLVFSSTPALSWSLLAKRVIDIVGSLLLIVLLSPLLLAIAAAIKLTSPGPLLFRQRRCTLHGRTFSMLKFRTMVSQAENLRDELEGRNEMKGPVFKIRRDPRVTRVGRYLRRHSLDELPQLFNVLVGDMSLVGPRPPIPAEVEKYEDWQRRRLSMRSGMTCLWQVSGRNDLSFDDWMRLDLEYIDNWSLELDLRILLTTPLAVIRGTGC